MTDAAFRAYVEQALQPGDVVMMDLIAEDGLTENRAAAPHVELPSRIAATMRSRRSPDSGAGMTSPPTHQNRLPRISIPDSAQHKSALAGPEPQSECPRGGQIQPG